MTRWKLTKRLRLTLSGSTAVSGNIEYSTPVIANAFTLSGPTTGVSGAADTFTVTPNGTMSATVVVTPAATNAASVSGALTFSSGSSAAQTFTVTRATDGASSVSITNNGGLSNFGTPITYTTSSVGTFSWVAPATDGGTINTGANTTTALAINVSGVTYYASPDLLPGQTLQLSGTTLNIVGDSTVPTVNSTSGAAIEAISDRDIYIEVMDSPLAIANHIRSGSIIATYGAGQASSLMYALKNYVLDGDIIEVSPGAVCASLASQNDPTGQVNAYLEGSGLLIFSSCTIRAMSGRGRWRLFPQGFSVPAGYSGIVVVEPNQVGGKRLTVTVTDFDITDQFGINRDDYGFRVRSQKSLGDPTSTWADTQLSVTLRNFKIGKTSGVSGSGIQGGPETWIIEDGDVFDCGQSGLEHNLYITGRYLTMRGVRSRRTRNGNGTPGSMDGHILKSRHANATIEGCVFEAYGAADNTDVLQAANGGNWTITGNLFIQAVNPSSNNGIIVYENEQFDSPPTTAWYYGVDGHSLTVRRNVFVSRAALQFGWGCPFIMVRHPSRADYVSGATFNVQDNNGSNSTLANTYWFGQSLVSGSGLTQFQNWTTNNSSETYDASDTAFSNALLKVYTRSAGPIASTGAAVSTRQFTWPHGSIARSDSYRGLA